MLNFTFAFLLACLPPQENDNEAKLFHACADLDVDRVTELLRSKADVNEQVRNTRAADRTWNLTSLSATPFLGDPWTGALAPVGSDRWTALMVVANSPRLPAPPVGYDPENPDHRILQFAVPKSAIEERSRNVIAIVNLLISHGADVTHADRYGVSALYCCVETDRVDVARILLKYGANPNQQVTARIDGPSGQTALHICRSAEMARLLLAYGADPKIKNSTSQTAIDKFNTVNSPFSLVKTSSGWHIREK